METVLLLIKPVESLQYQTSCVLARISQIVDEVEFHRLVVDHDANLILSLIDLFQDLFKLMVQENHSKYEEVFHLISIKLNKIVKYILIPSLVHLRTRVLKYSVEMRIHEINTFMSLAFRMRKSLQVDMLFIEDPQVTGLLRSAKNLQLQYQNQKKRSSFYEDFRFCSPYVSLINDNIQSIQVLLETIIFNSFQISAILEFLVEKIFRRTVEVSDIELLNDFLQNLRPTNRSDFDSEVFTSQKESMKCQFHNFLRKFQQVYYISPNSECVIAHFHSWMQIYCEIYQDKEFASETVVRRPGMENGVGIKGFRETGIDFQQPEVSDTEMDALPLMDVESSVEMSVSYPSLIGPIDSIVLYRNKENADPTAEQIIPSKNWHEEVSEDKVPLPNKPPYKLLLLDIPPLEAAETPLDATIALRDSIVPLKAAKRPLVAAKSPAKRLLAVYRALAPKGEIQDCWKCKYVPFLKHRCPNKK